MEIKSSRLGIEMGLVLYRVCLVLMFSLFLVAAHLSGRWLVRPELVTLVAAYAASSVIWVAIVRRRLLRLKWRVRCTIAFDQSVIALALWLGGQVMAPVFWAPIAVALGCGLLAGTYYAKLASAYAAVVLAAVFYASPFWSTIPLVAAGIVLATVLIPWHAALLADHISRSRRDMQRRAAAFEQASKTDSLTGVLNRAGFLAALQEQLGRRASNGADAVLMLLDLDGFKAVNDVGGHAGGDTVLKEVTRCLQQSLRGSDRIGRIGGDEFGIIACNLGNGGDAEWLAAKLLRAIESIRLDGHPGLRITGSIGIHPLVDEMGDGIDALLESADRLMYEAKRAGKNQYRSAFDREDALPQL
jgi:diguanylate cyclase (GGDEF)-like protein